MAWPIFDNLFFILTLFISNILVCSTAFFSFFFFARIKWFFVKYFQLILIRAKYILYVWISSYWCLSSFRMKLTQKKKDFLWILEVSSFQFFILSGKIFFSNYLIIMKFLITAEIYLLNIPFQNFIFNFKKKSNWSPILQHLP